MDKTFYSYIKTSSLLLFCFILLFAGKCNRGYRRIAEEKAKKEAQAMITKNVIRNVLGIKYTEVRRRFDNGLTFSPVGYQLVPEWRISFPSMDSVNIFSPKKQRFLNAPVVFDHDSVFNVAWAWLKLRYMTRDSMEFQVLHVHDHIIQDEKVRVFMTFYSNDYIKNVLHSDTNKLWVPTYKDTVFIKAKTLAANKNHELAFAGTEPAKITAKSPLITVSKEPVPDEVDGGRSYDAYLSPTYHIAIRKAYDDFAYTYTAYIDEKGTIIFRKSAQFVMPEFEKSTHDAMQGITDSYLKLYLDVKPGKTLGIPHTSIIFLNVEGTKK